MTSIKKPIVKPPFGSLARVCKGACLLPPLGVNVRIRVDPGWKVIQKLAGGCRLKRDVRFMNRNVVDDNLPVLDAQVVSGNANDALDKFRKLAEEPKEQDLQDLADKLSVVNNPVPTLANLQAELDSVGRAIATFHQKYDGTPDPGSARAGNDVRR